MRAKRKPQQIPSSHIIWNIGAYLRLSRDDGNEKLESDSITNSRLVIENHIQTLRQKGQLIGDVQYFVDDGISGTTQEERDALNKLDIAVDTGKINCVIVKDLSRLNRNVANTINDLDIKYKIKGVRFISINNPPLDSYYDPKSMDSPIITFQAMMDEMHARNTSIKIRDTFNAKRAQGLFIGAFAPYGYKKDENDKNRLIIDEDAAAVVKDIYNWFVNEGMSKNGIVKRLNQYGIPNPSTYKKQKGLKYKNPNTNDKSKIWTARTVGAILQNEMYLGHMVQGKHQVISFKIHKIVAKSSEEWIKKENTHEPIIDKDTFQKAQKLQATEIRTKEPTVGLLSGFIKCGHCHRAMKKSKDKTKYDYYRCRSNQISKDLCTPKSISCRTLEKIILEAIKTNINLIESHLEIIDKILNRPIKHEETARLEKLINDQTKELSNLENDKDALYFDYRKNLITEKDYLRLSNTYTQKINHQTNTINNLKQEQELLTNAPTQKNHPLENFLKYKNITNLERSTLINLIDTIYVHSKNKVEINFKFSNILNRLQEYITLNTENLKNSQDEMHPKSKQKDPSKSEIEM